MTHEQKQATDQTEIRSALKLLRGFREAVDETIAGLERLVSFSEPSVPTEYSDSTPPPKPHRRSTYLAVVGLLQEYGRSMTSDELRQELAARGQGWDINPLYAASKRADTQIQQVGRGRWALKA